MILSALNNAVWRRLLTAFSLLWLVSACTVQPTTRAVDLAAAASGFPVPAAQDVFMTGYSNINDKSLKKVPLADLVLEGMRGISSIDPSLSVMRVGNFIVLASSDKTMARFQAPADNDVRGWAAMTVDVSLAGRVVSEDMRAASAEDIYQAVFDAALSRLDLFSHYAGAAEAARNRAKRDGFGGIGVRFRIAGKEVRITRVLLNSPALRGGLKRGDVITNIDGLAILGMSRKEVISRLRGPMHSIVKVAVRRAKKAGSLNFDIVRSLIIPTTVTYGYDDGITFLKISNFNIHTASDFAAKLKKAELDHLGKLRGVVLDLRGNPGGLLKQSIRVAGMFLTQGPIITTRGRHPDSLQSYEARGRDITYGLPLVIVVDGKSASAAEVVAASLQDRGRAVVIGTSSFGKGTVQTVVRLPNGGEITLTWSRLIPPSGYVLHGLGVLPTICSSGAVDNYMGVVTAALANRQKAISTMEAWRTTSMENKAKRKSLRDACPAQKRENSFESEVARRLIDDNNLFRRVLNLLPAPATAQF